MTVGALKTLLVSILSLGRAQNVLNLMQDLPGWLAAIAVKSDVAVHIVVRNNDPGVSFDEVGKRLAQCEAGHPPLRATLLTGGPNLGFGRGHNENFRRFPSDYLLILNDDIGIPNLEWLPDAIGLLKMDPRTACFGAAENPQFLSSAFGNGLARSQLGAEMLRYAEASILLFSGVIFDRIGMFDERLKWAMCEDADLSLRAQQLGYRVRWLSMPHEHWRSTTFNTLPASVRSSIQENNRATLFSSWERTLATGRIGRTEVFDVWSDGMGDVFCALPHLLDQLVSYTQERRSRTVVNTSCPELVEMLAIPDIRIMSIADQGALLALLDTEGVTALHTIRDINYALPLNIHPLLCGGLGLPVCDVAAMRRFATTLLHGARSKDGDTRPAEAPYCVVHLEFDRHHDGRGLTPAAIKSVLGACGEQFETIVLIGKHRRLASNLCAKQARVVDLQGKLSLAALISVISGAAYFVGINSFPAHVAQAAAVRSAVFFGAIHPLARVWNFERTWPIVAELDCIGCYHTHIEPSPPFCMRRDQACLAELDTQRIRQDMRSMVEGAACSWDAQKRRFEILQGRWVGFMRHHPAPPESMLRKPASGNAQISNLIYQILDRTSELASNHSTTSLNALAERVHQLESDLFAREVELDELRRSRLLLGTVEEPPPQDTRHPIKIVQITSLALHPRRCAVTVNGYWLDVVAIGDDPLLVLPGIRGRGERVHFRLNALADRNDHLQIYWSIGREEFGEERQRIMQISPELSTTDIAFDLAEGELLWLRIDPLSGPGKARLRGSISGAFDFQDRIDQEPEILTELEAAKDDKIRDPSRRKQSRRPS